MREDYYKNEDLIYMDDMSQIQDLNNIRYIIKNHYDIIETLNEYELKVLVSKINNHEREYFTKYGIKPILIKPIDDINRLKNIYMNTLIKNMD